MIKIKDRIKRLRRGADYENYYTALDIGTEYIKALVVKREGRNGMVLGASRQRQEYADMQGGVPSDIQGIIDSCDRAMSQAEDMCDTIPGQAVIGIAGEQVKGFSTSINVPRADAALKISETELMQTLQLVQKRALREAQHAMSLELAVPDVDIALIRNGGVEGTRMFPIGGRVFTKKLAARFGISFADAEAVKLRHSRGELPPEHSQKVHSVLARDSEVLVEGIALTLQEMSKGERLPTAMYLAGGGSALPEVGEQRKACPWSDK